MKQFNLFTTTVLLLSLLLSASMASAQTVVIPGNTYAFQWSGDADIGLYFSSSNSRYEFRDLAGNADFWINPVTEHAYFSGTFTVDRQGDEYAIRGGDFNARGYVGVQGIDNFAANAALDLDGDEIGLLGIASDGLPVDNFGVYGFSNGTAIHAQNPNGNLASLGTVDHAAYFTGKTEVYSWATNQANDFGPLAISNGTYAVAIDANEIQAYESGNAGSTLFAQYWGGNMNIGNGLIYTQGSSYKAGIGTTSPRTQLDVNHPNGGHSVGLAITNNTNDNSWNLYTSSVTDRLYFYSYPDGGSSMLEVSFEVGGGTTTVSDARYKEDIQPIENSLQQVMQLAPKSYYYKHDRKRETRSLGFLAQEVREIFPDMVVEVAVDEADPNSRTQLMINYNEFLPHLVSSIQEQQGLIEEKDEVIATLEDKLETQEARLDRQEAQIEALMQALGLETSTTATERVSQEATLSQNVPNPFSGITTVNYHIPAGQGQLVVVDINGKPVQTYPLEGTTGSVKLDATDLPSGNYFYSLLIDGKPIETKQLNVTK